MSEFGRRALLGSIAAGATAIGASMLTGAPAAAAATVGATGEVATSRGTAVTPITVTPSDPRYPDMISGFNNRWVGSPQQIRVVQSTDDAVAAVGQAVSNGQRISVHSGGHCFENFVYNPAIQVVLDMSTMNGIYFDTTTNAFVVEAGANLLDVYDTLYHKWGVTIPAGIFSSIGMGGHAIGGGHGMQSRRLGLVCDYIYAVEVVVVDATGTAQAVVATSNPTDPNHDLWWAHTGGGGGNFGVVTRIWLRTAGATGTTPSALLPAPPSTVLFNEVAIPWSVVSQADFGLLLHNYTAWCRAHSAPTAPETALSTLFGLNHVAGAVLTLLTEVDASAPNASQMLQDHLTAIGAGTATAVKQALVAAPTQLTWGEVTRFMAISGDTAPVLRSKGKSAYLKGDLTDAQIGVIYNQLHSTGFTQAGPGILIFPYGGKVNAVASDATAIPQRDSVLLVSPTSEWVDPAKDDLNINWLRQLYQGMFAATGGVPVPDANWDGCYINYPDVDTADPTQNTSNVPWYTLYYKDNYPRLQLVKQRWDPKNVFYHTLSIQPPTQ